MKTGPLPPPVSPWWQHPDGLLHPGAPIHTDLRYRSGLPLAEQLQLVRSAQQVSVHFPLDLAVDTFDLQVRFGRLVLATTRNNVSQMRAVTLPDNLDLAHQAIRFRRGEVWVTFRYFPESTLHRNGRRFRDWLVSVVQRFWSWITPADD